MLVSNLLDPLAVAAVAQATAGPSVTTAIIGGSIGFLLGAIFAQAAGARVAWSEIAIHDEEALERNAQLVVWVDDRTRALLIEMTGLTNDLSSRGMLYSGAHGGALAAAKAGALHEFRDEEWQARIDLSHLRAQERTWHRVWRKVRNRPAPALTARDEVEPFLDRWREPVVRHSASSGEVAPVLDRTQRTTVDALAELPSLRLT